MRTPRLRWLEAVEKWMSKVNSREEWASVSKEAVGARILKHMPVAFVRLLCAVVCIQM
jgi:hypothetical protein